jgi:hypothetical protein
MSAATTPVSQPTSKPNKHSMRPVWITAVCLAASLTVTSIIFYQPVETSLLPSNIWLLTLININVILVVVLLLLLSRNVAKLYFERRHKLLGAGFRAKLVAAFVGLTLIPTFLLFIVASGLISSSIENWFGIQVELLRSDQDTCGERRPGRGTGKRQTKPGSVSPTADAEPPAGRSDRRFRCHQHLPLHPHWRARRPNDIR